MTPDLNNPEWVNQRIWENLKEVQARGSDLLEENRELKKLVDELEDKIAELLDELRWPESDLFEALSDA